MTHIPHRLQQFEKSKKAVRCRCCGKLGKEPINKYDLSKNVVGPIRIYIGLSGYGTNINCCSNCSSIRFQWSNFDTGLNNVQDYIYAVQTKMPYSSKVSYIYRVNKGEIYDNMAPIKKEKHYNLIHHDYVDYGETYSQVNWKYYRQMTDGEWCALQEPHSYKLECDEKYKKPFVSINSFTSYSHKPFKEGIVVMNTNVCFNMYGERIDNPHLVKLIGRAPDGNWIGIDYYQQYAKSVSLVVKWWKIQAAKYYGPKNEIKEIKEKIYKSQKTIDFAPFYRYIGFQSIKDCKACGGFTTNEEIAKGAKCIFCTHYKIDESYCSICDKKKTKNGTLGCPGCWKI